MPKNQRVRRAAGFIPAVHYLRCKPRGSLRLPPVQARRLAKSIGMEMMDPMNDEPFALFIIWKCYGTWLPGDRRGYASNTRRPDGGFVAKQNIPGTPYAAGDRSTRNRALQRYATVRLAVDQTDCVVRAMVEAAGRRGWRLARAAVISNHVHVIVLSCPDDGPAVRRILKGTCQAALSRLANVSKRWWTAGDSDRYLHDEDSILAAMKYVEKQAGVLAYVVDDRVTIVGRSGGTRRSSERRGMRLLLAARQEYLRDKPGGSLRKPPR